MKLKTMTVLSYSLMRLLPAKFADLGEWQHAIEPSYLFTGDIQRQNNTVRVAVELMKSATGEQIWCHGYERTMGPDDLFRIQDEIVAHVFQSVKKSGLLLGTRRHGLSMMAVA
jgi:TolB-like protein